MNKGLLPFAIILGLTMLLSACSSGPGGETTCSEYLALAKSFDEQIQGNEEQENIVKKMLADHDKAISPMNVVTARYQIIQFCGVDGTGHRMNVDRPIEEGINWN